MNGIDDTLEWMGRAIYNRRPTPGVRWEEMSLDARHEFRLDAVAALGAYDFIWGEAQEAARFKISGTHHLHDGRHCLCGFDSHGRARSATEHILDEFMRVAAGVGVNE